MSEAPAKPKPAPVERLRALRQHLPAPDGPLRVREPIRALCAQIRLDSSIHQSLRAAPAQAGPLNAQRVVVRLLQRLQQLSPAYLESLVMQVEALAAIEALKEPDKAAPPVPRKRAR